MRYDRAQITKLFLIGCVLGTERIAYKSRAEVYLIKFRKIIRIAVKDILLV